MDWQLNDLTQAAGGVLAFGGVIVAYAWEGQNTEHVVYVGTDKNIHELYYNGRWWANDLTKASGGAPWGGSKLVAYSWEQQNTEHVFHLATDGHIHELYYDGAWHPNDLTHAAGGVEPSRSIQLAGHVWQRQNTQHVFYVGADGHIHELYYDGAWHPNDLTQAAGGLSFGEGGLASYVWENQNTQHVIYSGTDGHVHELYYDGQWHDSDLTQVSGAPGDIHSNLTAFAWENKNSEHVFYMGPDAHIHELWYDDAHPTWHHSDLTTDPSGPPLAKMDLLAGYAWEGDNSEHVIYIALDGDIHELWHNGKWSTSDLSSRAGGAPAPSGGLAGYAWEKQNSEHVIYQGQQGQIYELWFAAPAVTPPLVAPTIRVQCQQSSFAVTGSGFQPSSTVYIRVVDSSGTSLHGPPYFQQSATGSGQLNATVSVPCAKGATIYFSANDGRPDPNDLTGTLWSNTVGVICC